MTCARKTGSSTRASEVRYTQTRFLKNYHGCPREMSSRTFKYAIYQGLIFLDCVGNGTAYGEDLRVYK